MRLVNNGRRMRMSVCNVLARVYMFFVVYNVYTSNSAPPPEDPPPTLTCHVLHLAMLVSVLSFGLHRMPIKWLGKYTTFGANVRRILPACILCLRVDVG